MKLLFDFFPVILFFAAFKVAGIYVATGVAIAATIAQVAWQWLRRRKVDPMLWASLVIIAVFGGATLALRSEIFIKWKPTVLYWLFGATLALSQLVARKNLIRVMLSSQMQLPDAVWSKLNWSWAAFFGCMGVANLYVAYHFPTDTWVDFKLFGGLGLTFLFGMAQALFLARHVEESGEKP